MSQVMKSTLRPGLLVSLNTSVRGNVKYDKRTVESDHLTADGQRKAVWETERLIDDPAEHEAATKVRSRALTMIRTICTRSAFGLLCPEIDSDKLDRAIAEARKLADAFNENAKLTRIAIYVIVGRIAADDVEAVKAINSEVSDLMRRMEDGIRNCDVEAVRNAANAAKNVAQMLNPEAAARVRMAIELARNSAKKIVAAGEEAAQEIDRSAILRIEEARTAFLDLDEQPMTIAAPAVSGRAVDLSPQGA